MKTKQAKEDIDKNTDEDSVVEPKTRARKKASDVNEDDKKTTPDEPKISKEIKRPVGKPKAIIKKRPLGIRKTLRSKKAIVVKEKIKNVIKHTVKRGRKPAIKVTEESQDKEAVPLIPASEIKKEPGEDTTPNSRSSSPKTAGRRQRVSSDMAMMKTLLSDSPGSLVLGPRTSPYSMRSERSNSPSMFEGKNLRSGKPRKVKNNLLNEVVIKEQKKRRRLYSDSKTSDTADTSEEKKSKRGRSCSRDGSEISKCSDNTESDLSMSETTNDTDGKELNKKLDKSKTDLDIDIENNVQISTIEKVPSHNDSKLAGTKRDSEPSSIINARDKRKLSLKRSTSLDSDNNNSNRIILDNLNSTEIEEKIILKTENNTLLDTRSSILTSMSKTFNSKEMSKNIRKARRGRKVAATSRPVPVATPSPNTSAAPKNCITSTITNDTADDKVETIDSLAQEISDLISNLDQNIDGDHEMATQSDTTTVSAPDQLQTKTASKFYGQAKPLKNGNNVPTPDTPVKDTVSPVSNETTPSKNDDSENIRLHYEEDSAEKPKEPPKQPEIPYKCSPVASIDKLMDRLKEFEEFDKRRQMESKGIDSSRPMMVTNDVVLIPKSGDIKPLKDIQSVRSPERPIEKENVLSCFENNSAISIVKRDQVRKSTDIDLPNSVTLIKRNSFSSRKESTSSNHSRESDAISIFEKSLGKDVTLTEIRKSVDKSASQSGTQVDLQQFASLTPTNNTTLAGVVLDSSQISITPRVMESKINNDVQIIAKRKSRESISRKTSESTNDTDDKQAKIEKMKSPPHLNVSPAVSITSTPVAIKSPETTPIETEALPPPIQTIKSIEDITASEVPVVETTVINEPVKEPETKVDTPVPDEAETPVPMETSTSEEKEPEKVAEQIPEQKPEESNAQEEKSEAVDAVKPSDIKPKETKLIEQELKPAKSPKPSKSARNSTESQPGPSNVLNETPESQKRKENVLRTLGLLTHKAAKEAKIEKLKEKERIYGSNYGGIMSNKNKAKAQGDYTGTLKTVIKLNRSAGDKKKQRSSLKITFQKSKYRSGKPTPDVGEAATEDDAYYTIERREGVPGASTDDMEAVPEPTEPKEALNLVIPEKASSFSIHPGRLCMDQCFYCGGKFGLFDTPCHIAQIKSSERQKKVLDNEEKLTIDSCLCDACYRHVDRRANCPSYRKRPLAKQLDQPMAAIHNSEGGEPAVRTEVAGEASEAGEVGEVGVAGAEGAGVAEGALCHTVACVAPAQRSIRRKWLIKMRSSVNKLLQLQLDYPGLHTIPLCGAHYAALAPLLACALCRRRLTKHHNLHFIHHGYTDLNPHLKAAGLPVQFLERPVLCKTCRYYCTLLQRPGHNDNYASGYRKKLLQIYNLEVPPVSENETEVTQEENKKKKPRPKSKQRKSTEPEKVDGESSERTSESTPEKEKKGDSEENEQPLEEDIESLISSNKILVPNATKTNESNLPSDGSEAEMSCELEAPIIPIDKQTELQYLLQKQNNPAQFLPKANLTQKQRNILKIHNISGIQKPGTQHRISESNSKRIQKLGQILSHKDKAKSDTEEDKLKEGIPILKNISLNEECTIETIPNKRPADINTLKNKWQMSESFTQVKKNLSELSKNKDGKKGSDGKYSNPVKRLETNPSISVRELFPGEEEMNLQCNIEFNNVKGVTPEGWEKCSSVIQYDVETKKLWTELQRPYGNQSSFLRHLILLEKYFRSGDLVLSHSASPHAATYSDSVQSRLRAYDNVVNDAPRRSEPAISLIEFRKKPSINGKSLLKSNLNEGDKASKKFMLPPGPVSKTKTKDKAKSKPLPPELIAINTPNAQGRKAIQNVLHNIQQLVKGVSASDPTEIAAAPLPCTPATITPKFDPPAPVQHKEKKDTPRKEETPKKSKATSKPWRPTLMPITQENLAKIAREPTQVAVDGRNLPSLVQVMSSGKRYHITLQDYNKMCIMRREKLQQLQDGEKTKRQSTEEASVVTDIQPSNAQCAMLGNGGTVVQNMPEEKTQEKKEIPDLGPIGTNAANILKNVGLKNITIAPIPQKTSTVTSQTVAAPIVTSPSLIVSSTPIKIPQLGPAVSIVSDTVISPPLISHNMMMPKIPKSLTVIPQTVIPSSVMVGSGLSAGTSGSGNTGGEGQRP